jgi:hypothetical protein
MANWIPDNYETCADMEVTEEELEEVDCYPDSDDDEEVLREYKWRVHRKPKLPEPIFEDVEYTPTEGTRLIDRFKESGLQIIVKLASIELTPEKPEFPSGSWHLEGQMNEHICGTALYYLDCENITDNHLSFRMMTPDDLENDSKYAVEQQSYTWMEMVFGTVLGGDYSPCLQNYGSVQTRQGRLLAFPNILWVFWIDSNNTCANAETRQHCVSPFKLIDPTKPGHRRFIALWLVDPGKRIISTANVPPQQMSWYAENLLGTTPASSKEAIIKLPAELVVLLQERGLVTANDTTLGKDPKLPEELMDIVRGYVDAEGHAMPMGVEEAGEHRLKLMEERSTQVKAAQDEWKMRRYNFCEH